MAFFQIMACIIMRIAKAINAHRQSKNKMEATNKG